MKKQRSHYEKSFKENAVKLSKDRKNVSELAHELGIEPFLLYRWRKEFLENGESAFSGKGNAILSEERKKIMELKKSYEHHLQERSLIFQFIKDYNSKQWTIYIPVSRVTVARHMNRMGLLSKFIKSYECPTKHES